MSSTFEIDWRSFDPYPENTCTCRCPWCGEAAPVGRAHVAPWARRGGATWRSHSKCPWCGETAPVGRAHDAPEMRQGIMRPEPKLVARKQCPKCGRTDDLKRVSSDPESMTVGISDIGKIR